MPRPCDQKDIGQNNQLQQKIQNQNLSQNDIEPTQSTWSDSNRRRGSREEKLEEEGDL